MSAVSDILFVVSVFREFGVPVTFEPGWETRGNGQSTTGYDGGLVHHTATGYSDRSPVVLRDGRLDLDGPLCNLAGLESGGIHVVAAQPANHAGASGGPSMGPLPVTRLFNPRVMGLEIVYPGDKPMTDAQYRTAQVFAIAIARLRGRPNLEWTRAHAETSIEGKWDPGWSPGRTIDMAAFRRDAATISQEDSVSVEDVVSSWYGPRFKGNENFAQVVHRIDDNTAVDRAITEGLVKSVAAALGGTGTTPAQIQQMLNASIAKATPALAGQVATQVAADLRPALVELLGADNAAQADEFLAKLGDRLRLVASNGQAVA